MTEKCLKCGYVRLRSDERLSAETCPSCGAVYAKVEAAMRSGLVKPQPLPGKSAGSPSLRPSETFSDDFADSTASSQKTLPLKREHIQTTLRLSRGAHGPGEITSGLMKAGKWISMAFAFFALLVVLASIAAMFRYLLPASLVVPQLNHTANASSAQGEKRSSFQGTEIKQIINEYQMGHARDLVEKLSAYDDDLRPVFISGLKSYLRMGDIPEAGEARGEKALTLTLRYIIDFESAVVAKKVNDEGRGIKVIFAGLATLAGMAVLIASLVLPVLIQIERNSRGNSRAAGLDGAA